MKERRKTPLISEPVPAHQCSIDLRLKIIGGLPFFAGLKPEEIAEINRSFHEKGFQSEETIFFAGDPASHLYVVADGRVKLMRHTVAGRDVLLELLIPGEFFGSLSAAPEEEYPETAVAMTPVCVLSIDKAAFRAVLSRYPSAALKVLDIVGHRLQSAREMVRQLSAFSVEKRIAYVLLRLADKLGKRRSVGLLIDTPLSREDLAKMTGATVETASRVMSAFQRQGLIDSGRQWVSLKDRPGLEAIASQDFELE